MIKNEAHVWKIINTGENFFFFPNRTFIFISELKGSWDSD